ncbi:MAG: LysM peptidoglycan-binding domain-containing protein [Candidatus Melainabacteria bacterium]|nr:MAG: LysM peptidoglycan-binding domain-containing protein [Candidatus Melainabacteria bacterium]
MLNRPVSQPAAAPDASIGAASGSPEFGGAISTASMESNMGGAAKADVMGAHQYFQGATGAESGLLGKMEITGLQPVGGDSSITAALIAKVNEAISPVIGMIMKLPGALGFMHSLFEVLGSFLLGNFNLFEMLNPMMLGQQAAASFSKIGETLGQSLGSSLSLLPGHAPIFDSLGHSMGSMGSGMNFHSTSDFLSMKLNTSISGAPLNQMRIHETFGQKLNGIGSMNKPMFEQSGLGHGTLSGPSLTGHSMAEQMAGHSRLFSDSLAHASKSLTSTTSNLNSISASNTPSSFASNANNALTAEVPRLDTSANSQISFQDAGYKMSSQSVDSSAQTASMSDASNIGPSGRVPDAMGGNKIASNFNMNQSQFASSGNGAAQAASQNTNGLSGLKAKQLSFENLAQNQIKPHGDVPVAKAAPAASADSTSALKPQLAEAPKHIEVPKHHVEAPKHQVHHAPKVHARHEAPKHHVAEAPKVSEVAQEIPQEVTGEMQSYTIQKGDNLWNLAKDHLGDGNRWNEIYALNKDLIGSNPNLIHTGSHLNMPAAGGSEVAHTASASSYTVQPGDNLWNVSKKLFGEGKNWGDIYSMNKDVIGSNPSLIQPGQQLQINSGSETLAGANQNMAPSASMESQTAQAQGLTPGADGGTTEGGVPNMQDAQMQPAPKSEAMNPQVESMAPSTNPNTVSSVDPSTIPGSVSQATTVANTAAYNNAGAVHAAALSKDLKSLFGS